jgi:hypothetical protein
VCTVRTGATWQRTTRACSRAEGRYCVLLSADDLLTPGALARATTVLDANPGVGFVYGHVIRWMDGEPKPAPRINPTGVKMWSASTGSGACAV